MICAEASPYVKVGGLADVAGALPAALRRLGAEVRLFLPRYGQIDPGRWGLRRVLDNYPVPMDWRREECQLLATPDGQTFFVENHYFFGSRDGVYGHGDDAERFVLFCRGVLEALRRLDWSPDVLHAHDWHAAAAVRLHWAASPRASLVFTVHNLAHQGRFGSDKWPLLGVYDGRGELNLMEQALYTADVITTVSPTYAQEIRRPEYGEGLDWMLRQRGDRLVGILNGIDTEHWNPATDPNLPARYSAHDLSGKAACKDLLQREAGLPARPDVPVLGMVSRLDPQKGIDLLLAVLGDIIWLSEAQVVVLGSGADVYEEALRAASHRHPDRIACYLGFAPILAHHIYAGSDIFLMPSRFEPCGLSQMIAMRYGTLPVARATGGLVDTITDRLRPDGVGYLFGPYDRGWFLDALGRALTDWRHRPSWEEAMRRAMGRDFSWERSARLYLDVYEWAGQLH
ncbi:MAG TPA: glycogen/starch synthase [Candidatus Nitrosotenuis sp.]|jgi:starch synthase|nr:glycogen/starch synthase [Candidatus Nitrosotenuis sp.]